MASFDEAKLTSTLRGSFSTYNPTSGANKNADSTPTALVYKLSDGTTLAATVTVTNITTGIYRFSVGVTTANGFAAGEYYELWVTAAVSGDTTVTQSAPIINFKATTNDVDVLSTLTQTQVTGGAYAINNASFAFNAGLDFTTTQKAATLARVTLNDTTTTNTDMRGTDNAALAATALSTTQWTNTLATNIGTTNTTVATNLDATVSGRMATYTQPTGFLAATFPATVASPTNVLAAIGTSTNGVTVQRSALDTKEITISWPVSGAVITTQVSINSSSYAITSGIVSFLRTESSKHYYNLSYNSADRPSSEGVARYKFTDGTYTRYSTLRVVDDVLAKSIPGSYAAGTVGKIVADSLDATVSSRMAAYTQPTGFLAATFPTTATVASTTNITAGTITTVTNLTNAPTAGDLTAAMKASVNAEVLDVMNVDTFAELAAPPAATSSLRAKITWLFMWARNKSTQSSTQRKLFADDTTTLVGTETVGDSAGVFTKGEVS